MLNKILVERRVARQHGRAPLVIDPVPIGGQFLAAMIDFERADLNAVVIEHHALTNLVRVQLDAVRRIAAAAHADIDMKRQRQVLHHLPRPCRPINRQRLGSLSPGTADPTGEPEIGKTNHMIGVMMGQKHAR